MAEKKHYATFDLFRILASFGVVFGHVFILFFQQGYARIHFVPWRFAQIEAVCVSIFFIISGIFIANSLEKTKKILPFETFAFINKKRFFRLYEPLLFATALYLFVGHFILHNIGFKDFTLYWPTLLMIGQIDGIPGVVGAWYISTLFFVGIPLTALLCFRKEISLAIVFPIVFLIGFSFLYAIYGNSAVHDYPRIGNFFSAGVVKCAVELIIGIELFYGARIFRTHFIIKDSVFSKIAIAVLEICSSLGMLYVITQNRYDTHYTFVIYPCCIVLFFIFLLRREVVFGFCSKAGAAISICAKYTLMLYLTHCQLVGLIAQFFDVTKYSKTAVMLITLFMSVIFAVCMHHVNEILRKAIRKVLCLFAVPRWGGVQTNSAFFAFWHTIFETRRNTSWVR